MFGHKKSLDDLQHKIISVEDVLMTNLPRVAATEQRLNAVDSRIGSLQSQLDMHTRRMRRFDEAQEEPAPSQLAPTHRGLGALPKPSAPMIKGLSPGQLQAMSTPPGSVVIPATDNPHHDPAPSGQIQITTDVTESKKETNTDEDDDDDESDNPLGQCRADIATLDERQGDLHDFVNVLATKLDRAVALLESLQVRVITNEHNAKLPAAEQTADFQHDRSR